MKISFKKMMNKVKKAGCFVLTLGVLVSAVSMTGFAEASKGDVSKVHVTEKLTAGNISSKGYDVVYVIDNSGSISSKREYLEARNKAFCNITNLAAGSDIRIGVVYFGDHVEKQDVLSLTSVEDLNDFNSENSGCGKVLNFLDKERDRDNNDTNIGEGLKKAYSLFDDSNREKIIILFSDGKDDNDLADPSAETKKQAEFLGEKEIPVYCVYLQNGNNDETELKNIVNYYGEDEFSEERFSSTDDPDGLSNLFFKAFYSMQNNMQYHLISPDAYGVDNFYVPDLGVSKIRVFMNLCENDMDVITSDGAEGEVWSNRMAKIAVFENPSAGSWSVEVTGDRDEEIYGTIVYDVNVAADMELIPDDNEFYKAIVHFYDQNGEEISVDDAAHVEVTFTGRESGEEAAYSFDISDGMANCEDIVLNSAETYTGCIHLQYSEFVNLEYMVSDLKPEVLAGNQSVVDKKSDEDDDTTGDAADATAATEPSDDNKKKESPLFILFLAVIMVILCLLIRAKGRKNKEEALQMAIVEYKKLTKEFEAMNQLCIQELVRAKHLREKAKQSEGWFRYDYTKLDQLKSDVLRKESVMDEMEKRWELVRKEMNDKKAATNSLKKLNDQLKTLVRKSEAELNEIREENKVLSDALAKNKIR